MEADAHDDDALRAHYLRRRRWTLHGPPIGCSTVLVAAAALWLVVGRGPAVDLLVGGVVAALIVTVSLEELHERSSLTARAFERGLCATVAPSVLARQLRARLDDARRPSLVLALQGRALPHGGELNVIIEVDHDGRRATIEVRCVPYREPAGAVFTRGELAADACARLRALTEGAVACGVRDEPWLGRDGFPCSVLIGRAGGTAIERSTCNLANASPGPIGLLAHAVHAASLGEGRPPLEVGSCDREGRVDIRPM